MFGAFFARTCALPCPACRCPFRLQRCAVVAAMGPSRRIEKMWRGRGEPRGRREGRTARPKESEERNIGRPPKTVWGGLLDAAQLKIKLTVVLETAPGLVELSRRTCSFFWGQRMREGVGVAISGLKCPPRLGLGPRYNAERPPQPITYPPPPPLLVLYNSKRGTPCSGTSKNVPSVSAG